MAVDSVGRLKACVSAHGRGHISVTVREIDAIIRISISDDGPGISEEDLPKVFDPFFTTKEVGEGAGLGLSVSYGIIAQMGGKLWAESDGQTGSTFHIEIPGDEQAHLSEENESRAQLHLLVVDDEPDLRNILSRVLETQHHKVDLADDGEDAWRKLQDHDYDYILLDLRMPGTDGQTLYKRISESDPVLATKVIFITGDIANSKTRSFLDSLTNPVLEKPITIKELVLALGTVTDRNLP